MSKNNLIIVTLTTGILLINTTPAFADNDFGLSHLVNRETKVQAQISITAQRQENNLSNLKQKADRLIDNRIDRLNKLNSRIQNDPKLSADEKSSLSASIQTDISGLTTLKAKIDADSDIATVRADIKQTATFKINAVIVPQTRILIVIDNLSALSARLSGLTPKLQDLINNLKSQGKDVSALQPLLDDINSQLSAINSKLSSDKSAVLAVTATTFNPQSTFSSIRQDLATVRADFAKIRSDIGQMRVDFKGAIHNTTGGPTSTPPSPTPTPSS